MAVILRYFNEFGKPAFQLRTTCSSIKHFDQKLASINQRTVKLQRVTKFTHSLVDTKLVVYRVAFNLLFKFHFPQCFDVWLPVFRVGAVTS